MQADDGEQKNNGDIAAQVSGQGPNQESTGSAPPTPARRSRLEQLTDSVTGVLTEVLNELKASTGWQKWSFWAAFIVAVLTLIIVVMTFWLLRVSKQQQEEERRMSDSQPLQDELRFRQQLEESRRQLEQHEQTLEMLILNSRGLVAPSDDQIMVAVGLSAAGDSIYALQKDGLRVWQVPVQGVATKAVLVKDRQFVIAGLKGEGPQPGHIVVYNSKGALVKSFPTGLCLPLDWIRSGRFQVNDIAVLADNQGVSSLLAAISYDSGWFASAVETFDLDGNPKGCYSHPGGLGTISVMRLGASSVQTLVVKGNNNDLTPSQQPSENFQYLDVVFALDPSNVKGLAPPYEGGSQIWYYVLWPLGSHMTRLVQDKWQGVDATRLETSMGCLFYLGDQGAFNTAGIGDACKPGTYLLTPQDLLGNPVNTR